MTCQRSMRWWLIFSLTLLIAACSREEPTPALETAPEETVLGQPSPTPADFQNMTAEVIDYDLGETTILQDHFPEDSPFREMPVQLDGVIGVPAGQGPFPLVLILHGSHVICPGEDAWPCAEGEEQPNYAGFTYLVAALAKAGYAALSINGNAEHTFAFGEAPAGVRTKQLVNAHLTELAAAVTGESDAFGLDLIGRIDLAQMAWLGHSRGGDLVNRIIREESLHETASEIGYGPVQGLIMLAPPIITTDVLPAVDVATALILPACDYDVSTLSGQLLYESARFDPKRQNTFTSVYLEHGNHANFNSVLEPDLVLDNRPDCTAGQALAPEEQQAFLAQYVVDFLDGLYGRQGESAPYRQQLGLDPGHPLPVELYGFPVQVTTLQPVDQRLTIVQPKDEEELLDNLLGGEVLLNGITAVFCPGGYYVPANEPGTEACQRVNFNQPGYPQQFAVSWDTGDAEWRTTLPASSADLTAYDALTVRAALDPLSERVAEGEALSFSIELVDGNGERAEVGDLELAYPPGMRLANQYFEGDMFSGHVTMHAMQIPMEQFEGIDLADVTEIALFFDHSPSGALFVADLALLQGEPTTE